MNNIWNETRFYLNSLHQEYLAIWQELKTTTNPQHRKQLHEWANNCLREFRHALDQYEKHQRDQDLLTQDTNQ